jgi:hypothetical protein
MKSSLFCFSRREEDEMKKIAEANRREKVETQLAKQRAIEQIEADKRARRERAAAEKSGGTVGDVPAEKPQHVAAPQPTRQYDECNLQVRLPDGSTIRQTFKAADRFDKVIDWIGQTQQSRPFILVQNYPKKDFNESDNQKSLKELGKYKMKIYFFIVNFLFFCFRSCSIRITYGQSSHSFSDVVFFFLLLILVFSFF